MASFLPSEIARLVLGYLEEVNCMTAYDEFLKNCPNLRECRGRHFDTRVMGYSLLHILRDYSITESEMYYNKNKELQRLLRQRWSLVQRMRFLVDNVDMAKVRHYTSNNSPFPLSTPRRTDTDDKPKLCPDCKILEPCSCSRGSTSSPELSDLFTEPAKTNPVQIAASSIPLESLVETTSLSDLPGTSVKDKVESPMSLNSKSCAKQKEVRSSHYGGLTTISQKCETTARQHDTCVQDKEHNVSVNSEHNMSIELAVKGNDLFECSEKRYTDVPNVQGYSEVPDESRGTTSSRDCVSNVACGDASKERDNSFQEFLCGVAVQYENQTAEVIGESSTPYPATLQGRIACATKTKPTVNAPEIIASQHKKTGLERKTIKTLPPRNATFPSQRKENQDIGQIPAKPPDVTNCTTIYETKPNQLTSHVLSDNEMITLYGSDDKKYTTLQTIDISSLYQQTNAKDIRLNQHFQTKPLLNEQKVIILSNEIVDPKITCSKEESSNENSYATLNAKNDKKLGVHFRTASDSSYSNIGDNNQGRFNIMSTSSSLPQSSNTMVNIPEPVVSQCLRAQICSTQSLEGGKGTVLAGKLPELIISNGQVQLGNKTNVSDKPVYYSETELMSMPTIIMLHSQTSCGSENESQYNGPSTSAVSFMAQELPPVQPTIHDNKQQPTSVHSHIPTQPTSSHISSRSLPSHIPTQPVPTHIPTQPVPSHIPTQPVPTHIPTQHAPSHIPTQPAPSHIPTHSVPSHIPTHSVPSHIPTQPIPGYIPTHSVPSHVPTQPVQTKPNLPNHTITTIQTQPDKHTEIDLQHVLVDLTEVATPQTNQEAKKSSSTPRRHSSHIRVLDFNTPSREICNESKARTLPKNLQATPISATRSKRRAKSNLFDIKESGEENAKVDSLVIDNDPMKNIKANHFDATSDMSQTDEKGLVRINVTSMNRNGAVVKPCVTSSDGNTKNVNKEKTFGGNDNDEKVPGLKEWQAIRRKEAGWDADLRKVAASDAAATINKPRAKPKQKPRRKIQPKSNSKTTETDNLSTEGQEFDTSLEKNAHLLELALSVETKSKPKKSAAPRKRNPSKKKKDQNADISTNSNRSCEKENPLSQNELAKQNKNVIHKTAKKNAKTSEHENNVAEKAPKNAAPIKVSPHPNHCIINDMASVETVPGVKQALDKKIISINVGHYVNEKVLREYNSSSIPLANNQEIKPDTSVQKENTEKVFNVSSDKEIESPLLPYDIISPDGHILIPPSAMKNLSSLLETPLKLALETPMMTPRFITPSSLYDPMSVLKHLEIPTPHFSNTPKANLHCKGATPSSYVSRPTDYSSGSSYYKPDENEYRIDVAADEDIHHNSNQEGNEIANSETNKLDNKTSKENTAAQSNIASKNRFLLNSLEISLEKMEAENNATPEQRPTRPRRTCTLKNLPRPRSPSVIHKPATKQIPNTAAPDFGNQDSSSSDSSCSSSSSDSSTNEESSNDLSITSSAARTPNLPSSTPKEIEIGKVHDEQITLTPQNKSKLSLQDRLDRSKEEMKKRTITMLSMSPKAPYKKPARPRVRKPPANKRKSVTKKSIAVKNINICIRRDSTKPVSLVRTVGQGKKGLPNVVREPHQSTALHKMPSLGRSRRKSSTPRKLHTLRLDTESESHSSISAIETNTSTLNDKANVTQQLVSKTTTEQASTSNCKQAVKVKSLESDERSSENVPSSVKRDDAVEDCYDIMQIQDYIANSSKCDNLAPQLDLRQTNHYESAKRIERDLLDPLSETIDTHRSDEESSSISREKQVAKNIEENATISNNTQNSCHTDNVEHNKSKLETCLKQGCEKAEETVEQTDKNADNDRPEDESDEEDVVEWTNSESAPGKSNYFCISYSGTPTINQFARNSRFNPETFCMSASVMVAETGTEDMRKMTISPLVTIVNIAPSKTKSRPSAPSKTKSKPSTKQCRSKKTNQKSEKKEKASKKITPVQIRIASPPKSLESSEKIESSSNEVSQIETLLAVQSIVQMGTLYTPDKSRTQLTNHTHETTSKMSLLSDKTNHRQPSEEQMSESIRKEIEKRNQRQIMKDIGLTDSSGGESDLEEPQKSLRDPGSCRKRRRPPLTNDEPPDKKLKPGVTKLDPQLFLKTMGIESVLSKIHGPSN